jgi:catechol 2,3-dioxygenase-like lactoylglutathione lyase family enzyme
MVHLPVIRFHTILLSHSWAECRAFYGDLLGFPIVDRKERFVEFQVTPESRIGLIDVAGRRHVTEGLEDRFVLSFCVDDLEATYEQLSSRRVEMSEIRDHPWGDRVLEMKDPEGRRIEFWTHGTRNA